MCTCVHIYIYTHIYIYIYVMKLLANAVRAETSHAPGTYETDPSVDPVRSDTCLNYYIYI